MLFIDDCQNIDLNCHGWIEASAGTGKTYTIESLATRLLKERQDIEIENILLVTFTEKAACELRIRIQEKLEKELLNIDDQKIKEKIKNTLDTFDTASIFTIHSFCHGILKDFAFENNMPFQSDLIKDDLLYQSLLKEQMRKHWLNRYSDQFHDVLAISDFTEKKDQFLSTIIEIAQLKYKHISGDMLMPDLQGKNFQEISDKIKDHLKTLKTLTHSNCEFSKGFSQLNFNATSRNSLLKKIICPLENYICKINERNFDLFALNKLLTQIQNTESSKRKGIECLIIKKWNKGGSNQNQVCPNLESIVTELQSVMECFHILRYILFIDSVKQLQKDVKEAKQNNGWISFDDMLTLVAEALEGDRSEFLLEKLREKYKAVFVDEFQDTDPVQWKIFKKIFLPRNQDNILFLIGDPKQAIYGFRGADVYAYLEAKNEMEDLAKQGQAKLYALEKNWRSEAELIHIFNHLFCRSGWFKASENITHFEIGYQSITYPNQDRSKGLIQDDSKRPFLNIVDLEKASKVRITKQVLAKFIAREILYLIKGQTLQMKEQGRDQRCLDFDDICILIRAKSEVPFIETELLKLNIPYTYYKKPDLFLSDEALYLSCVFHAILDSGNPSEVKKALLTPFFHLTLEELYAYESLALSHPMKQILGQWKEYTLARQWSLLFQSLIEDSGLLFRESDKPGWDRTYTNYRQILEHLQDAAYRKNLDFRGISALLDSYRSGTADIGDESDIHQIETEEPKVQIMTMHVSKGLQFPVVFIAGGLTQKSYKGDYYIYHRFENGHPHKIIDLCKSNKETYDLESKEENKRLYYVALTRAQYKLYLPFYKDTSKRTWIGPSIHLLSPNLEDAFSQKYDNKDVRWLDPETCHDSLIKAFEAEESSTIQIPDSQGDSTLFPSQASYQDKKICLESFSSLHQKRSSRPYAVQEYGFQSMTEAKEDDETWESQKAAQIETGMQEADKIPGGTEVGSMFHAILEHIDFAAIHNNDDEIKMEISKQREIFGLEKNLEDKIYQIIKNTLTTPILEDGFILADLRKTDRQHEASFYYPFSLTDTEYIRGSVDLVFRHNGKYYIVDWKSNRLDEGYDQQAMKNNMDRADYHLQYKIYTIAVLRGLKLALGNDFQPEKHFGGVFYLYLRGIGGNRDNGIYYIPWCEFKALDKLEQEIISTLHAIKGR